MKPKKRKWLGLPLMLFLIMGSTISGPMFGSQVTAGTFAQSKESTFAPELRVIPGGQSIGVKLKSKGVLVVGHHAVHISQDTPTKKSDIRVGDYLTQVNGKEIQRIADIAEAVEEAGRNKKTLRITLRRGSQTKVVNFSPLYDTRDRAYRLGIYIRDSVAGVGTLTFYDPQNKVYGALGHVISDVDTGQPFLINKGTILHSSVTSIQKGESGEPGEKKAIFFQEGKQIGDISKNTPFGIFGKMEKNPANSFQNQAVPIGRVDQVKQGPAKMLTVVNEQKVEAFNIEIVQVLHQRYPATKGLIVKITDPRLLQKTGGIVQGMSGSPILQGGKLVGAVTHVFVNDPTSGYGTFIEWMLKDAGVLPKSVGSRKGVPFLSFYGQKRMRVS